MRGAEKAASLLDLQGKVAVVTGGGSGIGKEVAKTLAQMGAQACVLDIDTARAHATANEIVKERGKAVALTCDVRLAADCAKAVDYAVREFGKIDVLCNNAGVAIRKNTVELPEAEWDLALDVTLKGVYLLSHYAIPHMIANGGGVIVNTGSGWALKGGAKAVSYCAAKGGVLNLTRAMAIDHGPHNIRVNCVCPGDIDTPMLRSECAQLGEDVDKFMAEAANRPLHRVGSPQDVANAVLFLASDMAKWITGTHLVVDGGGIA